MHTGNVILNLKSKARLRQETKLNSGGDCIKLYSRQTQMRRHLCKSKDRQFEHIVSNKHTLISVFVYL